MDQQNQTKSFFKGYALNWQKKASDEVYSVINDRHRAVHRTLSTFSSGSRLLDVGCGTGQLGIEAASNGFVALGLDFAEEMITQATRNAVDQRSEAKFQTGSIFEFKPKEKYDVISAMGFIEYISLNQLDEFLVFCNSNMSSNGAISIGSRNRLFNITTFNDYTKLEGRLGTIDKLFDEASICVSSKSNEEFINYMRDYIGSTGLVQNDSHPITGIEVATRYQFTPSDLMHRIEAHGFRVTNIYPVNYHAFHPAVDSKKITNMNKEISDMVSEDYQTEYRLLPNASSFVIEAFKVA
jgi:SAM-dependent methyltransferase